MFKLTVAFSFLLFMPIFILPSEAKKVCLYKGSRCPIYRVVRSTKKFEERKYNGNSWWASTTEQASGPNMRNISRQCYFRLRRYLKFSKMHMGVPVVKTIKPVPNTARTFQLTMSFFLSNYNAPRRPQPQSGVTLEKIKSFSVYVKVKIFTGRGQRITKSDADQLDRDLRAHNLNGTYYTPDQMYMTAGYDPPWVQNRRKEVWLVKKP